MRCTSIKKNNCSKCLNQKLTYYCVWLSFNLLHGNVVHLSSVERVQLLPRASIAIPILAFRIFIGLMSGLLALKASDLTQNSLRWCLGVGMVLAIASSIPVTILGTIMVV